ncbi:hypothetical protein COX05_03135 [candidate division WWE3 bacterium CG22_combo_CG10-13_8_21_14_all_39_12]|uniref:Peptidase S51 n=2 Tax=Katanobacteria TaxID=422282 RepID=A0A2M7X156_UNCKA|nr:MAG: hypothetical protein COX05_03135 [candidate division WWE3 bacterium CG22_combo_CG10-13_8_21_14_all_39_12]PJA39882.1 MAG: hypothetical protein CO179_04065 [candidate division WWE3 bacterium CG_4_9_14_3_um_filter_39_7]
MNLLLTSAGLSNKTLADIFIRLSPVAVDKAHVAFIDTASKVESDDWFVEKDINILKTIGIQNINRIDIAKPAKEWFSTLVDADICFIEGGNTFYLLHHFRQSGLIDEFTELMSGKLFVGVSAGSIIATPTIAIATVEPADPNDVHLTDLSALDMVDFEISPHTNDEVSLDSVKAYAKIASYPVYAIDDNSAVLVENGNVSVVGEGEWEVLGNGTV